MSKKAIEIAIHFEGLHDGDLSQIGTQPKMDCAGYWTEGYGKLMILNDRPLKGELDRQLAYNNITIHTVQEALQDLQKRYDKNEDFVRSIVKIPLNQDQIDALCLHYDNCGYSETLFSLVNKSMNEELKEFWTKHYIKSCGVILPGLIRRRLCEYTLFSTGKIIYET